MSDAATVDPPCGPTLQYLRNMLTDIAARTDLTARELVGLMEQLSSSALAVQSMAMAAILEGTDLDHTVPWPAGSTEAANLAVLCRRHHRLKRSPGWHVQLDSDGVMN